MKSINIVHIYPKEMNIYGDYGNVLVLQQRLTWRHLPIKIIGVGVNQSIPPETHLIVGGGGQDAGQSLIAKDLQSKATILKRMQNDGVPMLMICGMYQMFGHYFKTQNDEIIKGIGLLDIITVADKSGKRLIGNIISKTSWGDLAGYENHSGLTTLGNATMALGTVPINQGNNGIDKTEGAYQGNIFGSYMHGPLLAKSPQFADYLLGLAANLVGYKDQLPSLDDSLEYAALGTAVRLKR